jgi:hypothetical protein
MVETLFSLGSSAALAGWLLLWLLPQARATAWATGALVPGLLALAYTALVTGVWAGALAGGGGFGSLAEVRRLFADDRLLLAGWLHYLAFDLLIGRHIARVAREEGHRHLAVLPALVLCFLFGPAGWLLFQMQRLGRRALQLQAWQRLPAWLRTPEPTLAACGVLMGLLLLPTALAHALDARTLAGVGVWIKPMKFQLSLFVFLVTLALFVPLAGPAFRHSAAGRFVVFGPVLAAVFEVAYISLRAAMGQASHFNESSLVAGLGYALMGVGAVVLTTAAAVLGWRVWRARLEGAAAGPSPLMRRAIAGGLLMSGLLGLFTGAAISAGGSSFVGGGPLPGDLPLLGWSRTHGDLRVAHFFALHAMQALPLWAWLFLRLAPGRAAVLTAGVAVLGGGLTVATFVQAQRGLPAWPL